MSCKKYEYKEGEVDVDMDVTVIAETIELLNNKRMLISETDREFILWFAFATGDRELTDKLTEEL